MLQGLTQIEKKLGNMIRFYCIIIAAICLIFLLESCSNIRSVKNKGGITKISKKEKPALNAGKDMQVDTLNASIDDFINKIETSKGENIYEITEEDDKSSKANTAQSISSKRLPTLREQMKNLAEDQNEIRSNVNSIQNDVNDIKVSIDEIKDAVAVLNYNPNNIPERGDENAEIIKTNEDININSEDSEIEDNYNSIESDEVAKAKTSPEAKPMPKPKLLKKNQTPAKPNKNKDGASNKSNTKNTITQVKHAQNNILATSKIEPKQQPAQAPTDNIRQALDYFSKKDYQRAINELNIVLTKHNDPETLSACSYWLGESYFRLGNYQSAIKFFEKISISSNSSKKEEAKVMLGESNLRMGKVAEARQAFEQFITNYPKSKYIPRAKKLLQQL